MKHRVLYLNPITDIGGAERSLLLLLQHLDRQEFEPLVVLPHRGRFYNLLEQLDVEIIVSPMRKLKPLNPAPYFRTMRGLIGLLRRRPVDLIHGNMDICSQYALLPAKMFKIPLIVHTRNILTKRAFQRMFLFGPDVLMANSNAVLQSYIQYTAERQRKVIVHNGVDLDEFAPAKGDRKKTRTELGLKDDDFAIGLFGRIAPEKGHRHFFMTLAEIAKHHPKIKAVIAGDTMVGRTDRFLKELKDLVRRLGLGDKVIFPGFVDSMVDLYSAIDLLVCPSDAEPFGRVLIEAMAMRKPVIANRSGGALEVVEHGQNGFLLNTFDKEMFSRAIVSLLGNQGLCAEMGWKGRQAAASRFSATKTCEQVQLVYRQLLSSREKETVNVDL